MQVGVLALQGDFAQHIEALYKIGINACEVRKPIELKMLSGLIIPGAESTALIRLMQPLHWQKALLDFHARGGWLFGTCAGMILLASKVKPEQISLGLINIGLRRNAYGRQLESFIDMGECLFDPTLGAVELVFIRAPKITHIEGSLEVLVTYRNEPVMVRQNNVIVASFHPELSHTDGFYAGVMRRLL